MKNSNDTREKLMDTAIRLIWSSNYSNVGVAEICKQAGLTKGSFYHHFDSKATLFYESSMHYWNSFKSDLDEIFAPSKAPLDQLEDLLDFILQKQEQREDHYDDNPVSGCPFFTSGGQAGADEEKVQLAAKEMSDKAIAYNTALVRSLKGDGMLEGDPDPLQTGRMIYQYVMGLMIYGRVMRSLEIVRDDLREGIYRVLSLKPEYCKLIK